MRVFVCIRANDRKGTIFSPHSPVCVRERERKRVCVGVCVCERESVRVCACICVYTCAQTSTYENVFSFTCACV